MVLVDQTGYHRLFAAVRDGKNPGVNQAEQAFGDAGGHVFYGHGNAVGFPQAADLIKRGLKKIQIKFINGHIPVQEVLYDSRALRAITPEKGLKIGFVQLICDHDILSRSAP
jgi:hypothetical protein